MSQSPDNAQFVARMVSDMSSTMKIAFTRDFEFLSKKVAELKKENERLKAENEKLKNFCKCDVEMGSYMRQITVQDPFTKKLVGIDICILQDIAELWYLGIRTMASCCGHGKIFPSIIVHDDHIQQMLKLGYDQVDKSSNEFYPIDWLNPLEHYIRKEIERQANE